MAFRTPTRADDEAILALVKSRAEGSTSGEIAKAHGLASSQVRVRTNRVKDEDEKAEGQDLSHAYW